ncbi:MAG: hypothetical protein U0Q19_13260 [Kineosporiaceae bacterium]
MTHPTTGFEDPRPGLRAAWLRLASEAGLIGAPDSVAGQADALLGRWSAPTRQYHDVRHLRSVLDSLAVLTAPGPTPVAVELAAWFHDAVYDGRPGADEEASAVLAERVLAELKAPTGLIAEVGRLIRLTIDHAVAEDDAAGAVLVDADLAILGADEATYRRYTEDVRAEYAHLDDATFTRGRADVLRRLLNHDPLFRTHRGRELWQDAAHRNLAAELTRLSSR